ncbi:MAG: hypothetical protein HYV54_02065 [Parcubacteria group bacterium]|nr:hypothetical protein [Parcubacteria group bacterium]
MSIDRILPKLALVLILTVYGLFLAKPLNLVTADLGRHIKNGELIINGHYEVLKTNYYAYTYSDYPVLNHHWLSGVIFYAVWNMWGLAGLQLFFIFLSLAAFLIFFDIARKKSGAGLAALLTIFIMPLLLERDEIRPEAFSYLFSGVFLWLMFKYREGRVRWRTLLVLPILEIIWVNLHIYFFLGPVIIGVFILEGLILKNGKTAKNLGVLFLTVLAAAFANPNGFKGALAPMSIFKNFGYHLAENQPVWFIEKILPNPNYLIFKIVFFVLMLSFVLVLARNKRQLNIPGLIFAIGFSIAGWLAIRNFAIFSLFALPIAAANLAAIFKIKPETARWLSRTAVTTWALAVLIVLSGELKTIYPKQQSPQLGLENGNDKALDFFKENKLSGPIFNNYDIGGYLIYGLYPQEKVYPESDRRVFVDNRPEAYPADFFTKTYIPMQEDKDIWQEKSGLYKFNAIIFSYRDYTPWGQTFFRRILDDPDWTTVFADKRVIILLKNNEVNKDIIAKYGKPLSIKR